MKTASFALIALIALSASQSKADARSIATAICDISINGRALPQMSFSLEQLREPRVLARSSSFTIQAKPLLANPVMNDQLEDTINPVGLELISASGTIEGVHAINYGEGTSTLKTTASLVNGETATIEAKCENTYVE